MSLIPTWKNVDGIDAKAAILGLAQAGELANKGIDAFGKIISDQNVVRKANYDVDTETLNRTLQAEVAKTDNITGLKDTLKTKFSAAALQNQFGNRIDLPAIKQAGIEQEAKLTTDAFNKIIPVASAAADKGLSPLQGLAVIDKLGTELGVDPITQKKFGAEFVQMNAAKAPLYAEQKNKNKSLILSELPIPKTNAEMPQLLAAAKAKAEASGLVYDEGALKQDLVDLQKGALADRNARNADILFGEARAANARNVLSWNQQQAITKENILQKKAFNATTNQATNTYAQTMNKNAAYKIINDDPTLDPIHKTAARAEIDSFIKSAESLSTPQMLMLNDAQRKMIDQNQTLIDNYNSEIQNYQAMYQANTGTTPQLLEYIGNLDKSEGGFIKSISAPARSIGLLKQFFTTFKDGGNEAAKFLSNKYNELSKTQGDTKAKQILLLSMQDTYGENLTSIGDEGINERALTQNINNRIDRFSQNKHIEDVIVKAINGKSSFERKLTDQVNSQLDQFKLGLISEGITGKPFDKEAYQQQINNNILKLPEATTIPKTVKPTPSNVKSDFRRAKRLKEIEAEKASIKANKEKLTQTALEDDLDIKGTIYNKYKKITYETAKNSKGEWYVKDENGWRPQTKAEMWMKVKYTKGKSADTFN